jgi:hypothetical protein
MPLIIPANSITGGFEVANSLRFNSGSSDYLTKTPASAGNRKTFTFSTWIKRSQIGATQMIVSADLQGDASYYSMIYIDGSEKLVMYNVDGSADIYVQTNRLLRDTSAWYHIVVAIDTTQGTASNRIKFYINGVQETSLGQTTYPSLNSESTIFNRDKRHNIGNKSYNNENYFNGYLSEFCFIDGQQLDPTSFGEFDEDTGIWKPISVSGLTFGTNGFYLDFEDSAALGDDVSGNGNDFTVNNLTAIDQSTDTCTNNYCTLNPLDPTADITLSEGNLKGVYGTSGTRDIQGSTFGVSSGKWYWEIKIGGAESPDNAIVGVTQLSTDNEIVLGGATDNSWGYRGYDAEVYHNNSSVASYATFDGTSIIGIYLDLDNHKLYFSKDGSLQSATGISLDTGQDYFPAISDGGSSATPSCEMNFGSPSFSISSGNTDANGYGNFEYSATITGDGASKNFLALNTKNLSEVLG